MAIRTVLRRGDPRLRAVAAAVPAAAFGQAELANLVRDLLDTQAALNGAGLAAPQIGVPWRVVVIGTGAPNPRYPEAPVIAQRVLCNPSLSPLDDTTALAEEGCLSVPDLRAPVRRWTRVQCEALTPAGEPLSLPMRDFEARVLQHECDHLDGVLFPDRMAEVDDQGLIAIPQELPA